MLHISSWFRAVCSLHPAPGYKIDNVSPAQLLSTVSQATMFPPRVGLQFYKSSKQLTLTFTQWRIVKQFFSDFPNLHQPAPVGRGPVPGPGQGICPPPAAPERSPSYSLIIQSPSPSKILWPPCSFYKLWSSSSFYKLWPARTCSRLWPAC